MTPWLSSEHDRRRVDVQRRIQMLTGPTLTADDDWVFRFGKFERTVGTSPFNVPSGSLGVDMWS